MRTGLKDIVWTDYMKYRSTIRGIDLGVVEEIVRHSSERYMDNETRRSIVIGRHGSRILLIPYEESESSLTPITVHTTTRQQINFRLATGRYSHG